MTALSVTIPDEPPESTVVATHGGTGKPWARRDPIGQRGGGWWHPAGSYYDDRDNETHTPLRWYALVAKYGPLAVLRWGNGEGGEPAGHQHPDLAARDAEIQRLTDLVDELRRQLESALRVVDDPTIVAWRRTAATIPTPAEWNALNRERDTLRDELDDRIAEDIDRAEAAGGEA